MKVNSKAVKEILNSISPVTLVAATKYVGVNEINELEALGCLFYGENRVQAFLDKYEKYQGNGRWHFIGTLQTNKVKYIIDKVDLIHSVNTLSLIKEIEKQASKHNINIHILLEVNIADEQSKQGFDQNDIYDAISMETCVNTRLTIGAPSKASMEMVIKQEEEYLNNSWKH